MTTIRDVAERAQVSVGTVSRVINDHPSVSPAIRRVVLEAVAELHYQPNAIARTLRTAKTHTIGLLVANMRNADVAAAAISGAEAAAQEHGYALFVANTRRDPLVEEQYLRNLLGRQVDGLLCSASMPIETIAQLVDQAGVPAVIFGQPAPSPLLPTTVLDFSGATAEAIEDLRRLGHHRIGTVTHASDAGMEETIGWGATYVQKALKGHRVQANGTYDLVVHTTEECTRLVSRLMTRSEPPTALFVTPLYLIPAVIEGIRAAGAAIPADVSLIGFGDSPWAQVVEPPISVIAADVAAHLDASTRLLVDRIDGAPGPLPAIAHQAAYLRRGSVQPPPVRSTGKYHAAK